MSRFTIWVDADSCPVRVRRIVERAANSREVSTRFVADRTLPITETTFVSCIVVDPAPHASDELIAGELSPGDLVITRDVDLTDLACRAGATVLDDRGRRFEASNVGERTSIHRFMDSLRRAGAETRSGGSSTRRPTADFANSFDATVTELSNRERQDGLDNP